MKSRAKLAITILITAAALSACGIKPGNLTPPKNVESEGQKEAQKPDLFPHAYPKDPEQEQIKSKNR